MLNEQKFEMDDDQNIREQIFHNTVREYIIFMLLFAILYVISYAVLSALLKREKDDDAPTDLEEVTVQRICMGMCTFSLTVSVGAALLLPISILSNEVLLRYPSSYYMQWLNSSLIQGLWNHVFLFSNVSIFVLLPFAYLFTESEGFVGQRGIMGRVYEASVVQLLLAVVVLGILFVVSALIDTRNSLFDSVFNIVNYLPLLYSCVSFLGVLLLLLGTPLGFARLFTVLGQVIVKPHFLRGIDHDYYAALFEEQSLREELEARNSVGGIGPPVSVHDVSVKLADVQRRREELDYQRKRSPFFRRVVYPVAMVVLLALTVVALLNVVHNMLQLLVGIKALPLVTQEQFALGITSLSMLGLVGAGLEVVLIGYLLAASTVGLYTLPLLSRLRPRPRDTPLTHLILNCALLLVLSSALPLLSRILGITNFDLLGNYGRIEWLGNFYLVLFYNVVFVVAAAICLGNKVTNSILKELWRRLKLLLYQQSDQRLMNSSFSSPVSNKDD